jgi:hypothetical protein
MNQRQLRALGISLVAAGYSAPFLNSYALSGPAPIQIDGGPLGNLEISGGVEGYGNYLSGKSAGVVHL